MTHVVEELAVYFTVLSDGSHLAASASEPFFTVAGATREEAQERAQAILDYHNRRCVEGRVGVTPPQWIETASRTVRPFLPSHVEHYRVPECVAG